MGVAQKIFPEPLRKLIGTIYGDNPEKGKKERKTVSKGYSGHPISGVDHPVDRGFDTLKKLIVPCPWTTICVTGSHRVRCQHPGGQHGQRPA